MTSNRVEAVEELRQYSSLELMGYVSKNADGSVLTEMWEKLLIENGKIIHESFYSYPYDGEFKHKGEISWKEALALIKCNFERFPIVYVNAYAVSRDYGGPEEGGWYYNAGEPLASMPVRDKGDAVDKMVKHLEDTLGPEYAHERSIYSVLGDGQNLEIRVQDNIADYWPKQRPHYE
jgi:hypothetical protein